MKNLNERNKLSNSCDKIEHSFHSLLTWGSPKLSNVFLSWVLFSNPLPPLEFFAPVFLAFFFHPCLNPAPFSFYLAGPSATLFQFLAVNSFTLPSHSVMPASCIPFFKQWRGKVPQADIISSLWWQWTEAGPSGEAILAKRSCHFFLSCYQCELQPPSPPRNCLNSPVSLSFIDTEIICKNTFHMLKMLLGNNLTTLQDRPLTWHFPFFPCCLFSPQL